MELDALQTVVSRLFSDADFRARAMANADAAIGEFDLGADERVAVLKLCDRMSGGVVAAPAVLLWF